MGTQENLAFGKPEFQTDYSFQSPRALIRIMSDAFSRQHCDYRKAKIYASEKTKGKCIYCGKHLYDLEKYEKENIVEYSNEIHYDHLYPAIQLNLFEVGNVALSCDDCNLDKSSRLPLDYYDIREAQGLPLYINNRDEFEKFLDNFVLPYKKKWPQFFEIHQLDLTDEEFKEKMSMLLEKIDISPMSNRYGHESSVNILFWEKVVERSYQEYAPLSAKDIEARIGYTNQFFEEMFGSSRKIEDSTVNELGQFTNALLNSKYESKGEIQKFRRLIKVLVDVLNEEIMEGQLKEFYQTVPTYAGITKMKNNELLGGSL